MWKKILQVSFILVFLLVFFCACSETDPDARVIRLGAGITDHVGLSSVEAPEEASIYLAEYREVDFDEAAETLLLGKLTERKEEQGVIYAQTEPDEEGRAEILSIDPGNGVLGYSLAFVSPDGEVEGYAYSLTQEEGFSEQAQLMEYHHATMKMPEEVSDNETCHQAERLAEEYMDRLGIIDYRLRAAAKFQSADQTSADCYMLWEQTVDNIPITWLEITDNMDAGRRSVYNSSQGFNHDDIRQIGSFGEGTRMIMHVTDGQLTDLEACLVEPTEPYETRRIVTAGKAFRLVEEVYQQKSEETDPRLELAELQYKCLEQDGQIYLYPVWVFGIAEYDTDWAKADEDESWRNQWLEPGDYYHYYIIDAFSGELLLDPGLE